MNLAEELENKRRKDGLDKTKFYICPQCKNITESFEIIQECKCGWKGEIKTASTKQKAQDVILRLSLLNEIENDDEEITLQELRYKLLKGHNFIKGSEVFIKYQPIYYDTTKAWWVWNQQTNCWEEKDETHILNLIRAKLNLLGDTSVRYGNKLLEALRQVSRHQAPIEPPLHYIQFGKYFIDIKTGNKIESTPEYFSTNSIPWDIGLTDDTPEMDKLIISWVGEEYKKTLYQFIAYCCYRDYPIHRIFCMLGTGANGKSRVNKIIEKLIGSNNKSSVTIKNLTGNNFALYPLYKKLVCFIGETTHHKIETTEILKQLSGQDPVSFEAKGRDSFTGSNYAKLIVGTNVLPPSTDTSRGWDRRWLILRFPNEFSEGEDVLARIPDVEYNNLCKKITILLPELLLKGGFDKEGSIDDRKIKYQENSNPIKSFINTYFERDVNARSRYAEVYLEYLNYLSAKKMRRIDKKEFTAILEDEGLETQKTSQRDQTGETVSFFVIWGIKKKPSQRNILDECIPCMPCMTYPPNRSEFPLKEIESDTKSVEYRAYKEYKGQTELIGVQNDLGLISKQEVYNTIYKLQNSTSENISFDLLYSILPIVELESWIGELLFDGLIFEFKPKHYRIVTK